MDNAFLVFAFGTLMLAFGLAWRTGLLPVGQARQRWYHHWYRNPDASRSMRSGGSSAIPMGAGLLVAAAAFALDDLGAARTAVLALVGVALGLLAFGGIALFERRSG